MKIVLIMLKVFVSCLYGVYYLNPPRENKFNNVVFFSIYINLGKSALFSEHLPLIRLESIRFYA